MKTKIIIIMTLFFAFVATSCKKVEMQKPVQTAAEIQKQIENNSKIILKSAAGFKSTVGTVYVQVNIGTGLKVESKTSVAISSASWTIGTNTYNTVEIFNKFTTLGETAVTVAVKFTDNTTETRTFKVQAVVDLSKSEPLQMFVTKNADGSCTVKALFNKERVENATDSNYYFNGLVTNWVSTLIPTSNKYYIIATNGAPQAVKDVGKYIDAEFTMKITGLYNIALVSGGNWVDLSGSSFLKKDNPGLAWFYFDAIAGTVVARGDSYISPNLPGATGDNYFRFEQIGDSATGKVNIYFKLDATFTGTEFAVKQLVGGAYTDPITMAAVTGYTDWGQIQINASEVVGKVLALRYGPNKANPTIYAKNMAYTVFFSTYFNNIRFTVTKV